MCDELIQLITFLSSRSSSSFLDLCLTEQIVTIVMVHRLLFIPSQNIEFSNSILFTLVMLILAMSRPICYSIRNYALFWA